jgi:hypothetical protein
MDGSSQGVFFYVLSTLELVAQVASDMDRPSKGVFFYVLSTLELVAPSS